MEYYDLVQKSIVSFMKGKTPTETSALKEGGIIYTQTYFDDLEKRMEDADKKPSKKKDVLEVEDDS